MSRVCGHCGKTLVEIPRNEQQAEQHCTSKACHWCTTCGRKRGLVSH